MPHRINRFNESNLTTRWFAFDGDLPRNESIEPHWILEMEFVGEHADKKEGHRSSGAAAYPLLMLPEWLTQLGDHSQRLISILHLATDLLVELNARHAIGNFTANLSEETIRVRVPDGKGILFSPNSHSTGGQGTRTLDQAVFMAPEQSGTLQRQAGPPADLYSVGVFLYRTISRCNPIPAVSLSELLLKQMTNSVSSLRWNGNAIPRCLDEFVLRLLKRDPKDRYQSAEAALYDLRTIIGWLQRIDAENVVLGFMDRRERLTDASFVERDSWLQVFVESLGRDSGELQRLLVVAKQGEGKTRLLDEFAKEAKAHGALVIRAQGLDNEHARPLEAFDSLCRDLHHLCNAHANLRTRLAEGLSDYQESIRGLLPWLFDTELDAGNVGPEKFAGRRFIRAIERLLDLIHEQPQRVVMLIDNVDRLDELSRSVLGDWLRSRATRSGSLQFVGTASTINLADLQMELTIVPKTLEPLSVDSIVSMLQSMIGTFPIHVLELTAGASAGNPSLAISMLQGIIESGGVQWREGKWHLRSNEPLVLQSHRHATDALDKRIQGLNEEVIRFLTAGAILGNSFSSDDAQELAHWDWNRLHDSWESAVQRQLIWSSPDRRQMGFVHADVRQFLLDRLSPDEKKGLHLRAAKLIDSDDIDRSYALAYHYDSAECRAETVRYALQAAKHAHRQYANESAIRYYRLAQKWIPEENRCLKRQTAESIGEVFLSTGNYDGAETAFEESIAYADAAIDRTRLAGKLGDVEFKRGRMSQAASQFVAALALSGVQVPRNSVMMLLQLIWQMLQQANHTSRGRPTVRRQATPIQRLHWTLFSRLAHTYWFSRGALWTMFAHLKGMNDAERFQDTPELAKSYSEHAPVCSLLRWFTRAERYSARSLSIRMEQKDLWGQGQTLAYSSVVQLAATNFHECIKTASEAIELLNRTGDAWETNMAGYQRACALYRAGRFREAVADAKRIHQSGVEIGDDQVAGISLDVWMRCAPDQVDPEIVAKQAQVPRTDAQSHAQTQLALALVQLRASQYQLAESTLRGAIARCKKAGHLNTYICPCYAWLITVLREQAASTPRFQVQLFRKRLKRAWRAAKIGLRVAQSFPADVPHCLREIGILHSLSGNPKLAVQSLRQSIAKADQLYSPMQSWESLTVLATFIEELGDQHLQLTHTESERLIQLTDQMSDSIRCLNGATVNQESLSLADRFDTLLEDGRRIARSLDQTDIYRQGCLAAQHLLRGQIAMILVIDSRTGEWQVSERLATGAVATVYASYILQDETLLSQIRNDTKSRIHPWDIPDRFTRGSVLANPIRVRESVVAYLLVGHAELDNLFGNEELQVAEFIATLTGAALENAEGFEELYKLNATLEQRVAERTAAAELRTTQLIESNDTLQKTQKQLHDAIEIANAASLSKSRFLATMSHEIRTPLNGILGMSQLALANSPNQQLTNYLSTIKRSGDSLLRLLNDLLDFSKIEAGKMTVESIAYDPSEVLMDVVGLLSIAAWQKNIEVAAYLTTDLPSRLMGDPVRMRQIMLNLIGNAIKFTSQGYVEVRVEVQSGEMPTWSIRVVDTGIGIPEDKQESIFEAFSQADNSTTRKFGGTGLGLSISSELVQLMNGTIHVQSQPNVGSEFCIVLPLVLDDSEAEDIHCKEKRFVGQNILIVEPCEGSRRCIEQTLVDHGAKVISFDTWFDQSPFDRPDLELFDAIIVSSDEGEKILNDANEQKDSLLDRAGPRRISIKSSTQTGKAMLRKIACRRDRKRV